MSQIKFCSYEKLCEIVKKKKKWHKRETNEFVSVLTKESGCYVRDYNVKYQKNLSNYICTEQILALKTMK